jgi:hypothetical protein
VAYPPLVRMRLGPTAYLGGMTFLGIVAALVVLTLRGAIGTAGPSVSQSVAPTATRVAVASSPATPTSFPTTSPIPSPTRSTEPTVPGFTPLPGWLTLPANLWGDPGDSDRDGLSDADEARLGTNPDEWDSDSGGENDGSEAAGGRDPHSRADDVKPKSACIPEGAKPWDGSSPKESPPPAPELERLLPDRIAGQTVTKASMRGLPRAYGLFNYTFDAILLCAGGQPEDLSHAIGVRGQLPNLGIFAIRIAGADPLRYGRDLMADLEAGGRGRRILLPVHVDGRDITFLLDGDAQALTFATYASGDVLFLMTGLSATDAGLFGGGPLDPEHVREAVAAFRTP